MKSSRGRAPPQPKRRAPGRNEQTVQGPRAKRGITADTPPQARLPHNRQTLRIELQCIYPSRPPTVARGRRGTIYRTHQYPGGNEWMWFLNGITNGPVRFNGFAVTLDDAKAEFAASWRAWLKPAGLSEDTPTAA